MNKTRAMTKTKTMTATVTMAMTIYRWFIIYNHFYLENIEEEDDDKDKDNEPRQWQWKRQLLDDNSISPGEHRGRRGQAHAVCLPPSLSRNQLEKRRKIKDEEKRMINKCFWIHYD